MHTAGGMYNNWHSIFRVPGRKKNENEKMGWADGSLIFLFFVGLFFLCSWWRGATGSPPLCQRGYKDRDGRYDKHISGHAGLYLAHIQPPSKNYCYLLSCMYNGVNCDNIISSLMTCGYFFLLVIYSSSEGIITFHSQHYNSQRWQNNVYTMTVCGQSVWVSTCVFSGDCECVHMLHSWPHEQQLYALHYKKKKWGKRRRVDFSWELGL